MEKSENQARNVHVLNDSSVTDCKQPSFSLTTIAINEGIHGINVMSLFPSPTPLCKSHYHIVYNTLQARQRNCRTCCRHFGLQQGHERPCPQPQVIQAYLHVCDHTDFEGDITECDCVCLTCCKSHLVVLSENKPISTEHDLMLIIDSLTKLKTHLLKIHVLSLHASSDFRASQDTAVL